MTTPGNDVVSAPRITRASSSSSSSIRLHSHRQALDSGEYTTAGTTTDRCLPADACMLLLMNASAAKSDLILLSSLDTCRRMDFEQNVAGHLINSYTSYVHRINHLNRCRPERKQENRAVARKPRDAQLFF